MQKSIHTHEQQVFQSLLKKVRKEQGLTQVELAERLDTVVSRISDYENGNRRMDLPQLLHYCVALRIDLTDFVRRFVTECRSSNT